jgi:hypothetical protein
LIHLFDFSDERNGPRVSFTVKLRSNILPLNSGQKLVWDSVLLNQGGGYDTHTGVFTSIASGFYHFAVYTRSNGDTYRADVKIETSKRDTVCSIDLGVGFDAGVCQGVVYLARGDQVWVVTNHCPCGFVSYASAFSGFLVKASGTPN